MTEKKWARKYDKCIECGRKKYPHVQHGYCTLCWSAKIYQDRKIYYRKYYKKYYKENKTKINKRNHKYYHDNKK